MYTLYNVRNWGSLAPNLVLEELEIPYQNLWLTPEQVRAPGFRDLSPLGLVPVLRLDDGRAVFESAAIVIFLTDAHQDRGLAPRPGSPDHAMYLAWMAFMSSNLYCALSLIYHPERYADAELVQAALKAKAVERSNFIFDVIEERLRAEGPWVLGEDFSAADLYLFMLAVWAKPNEAALHDRCPWIGALATRVRERPRLGATIDAHGVAKVGCAA